MTHDRKDEASEAWQAVYGSDVYKAYLKTMKETGDAAYVAYKEAKAATNAAWKNIMASKDSEFGAAWCAHEAACRALERAEAAGEKKAREAAAQAFCASQAWKAYKEALNAAEEAYEAAKAAAREALHASDEWQTFNLTKDATLLSTKTN